MNCRVHESIIVSYIFPICKYLNAMTSNWISCRTPGLPTASTTSTANETLPTPPSPPAPASQSTLPLLHPSAQSAPIRWRPSLKEEEEVERCNRLTYVMFPMFTMASRVYPKSMSMSWAPPPPRFCKIVIPEVGEGLGSAKAEICKVKFLFQGWFYSSSFDLMTLLFYSVLLVPFSVGGVCYRSSNSASSSSSGSSGGMQTSNRHSVGPIWDPAASRSSYESLKGAPAPPRRSDSYAAIRNHERPNSWSSLEHARSLRWEGSFKSRWIFFLIQK